MNQVSSNKANNDKEPNIDYKQQLIKQKTESRSVDLLYANSIRVAFSYPIIALVMAFYFSKYANIRELVYWALTIGFLTSLRFLLQLVHKKYKHSCEASLWEHTLVGISVLLASVFSSGLIYFMSLEVSQHITYVIICLVTLSAASVIAHAASIYATASFYFPMVIPITVYLLVQGTELCIYTSAGLILYTLMMLSLFKPLNKVFQRAISVKVEHEQEVESRLLLEQKLQDISHRDSLTGLFNRRYFEEMLNVEIGRAHRNHVPLCLIMFEVDCFKEYNDRYGHINADNSLIKVAQIAESLASRKGDLVARYGGEEFAIILPNIDIKGALAFANKLRQRVQQQRIPHETTILTGLQTLTISLGVTNLMPFSKVPSIGLIEKADTALYEAKRQGCNRVYVYENTGLGQDTA